MMVTQLLKMNDKVTRAMTLTDRADMLIENINSGFLVPVERKESLLAGDIDEARMKADMLQETLDELQDVLEWLDGATNPQTAPVKDHKDMTRAERIDEILNDVNVSVGKIEKRPDWLECLKYLNAVAMLLADGAEPKMQMVPHMKGGAH